MGGGIGGVGPCQNGQQSCRIRYGAGKGSCRILGGTDGDDAGAADQSLGGLDADHAVPVGGAKDRAAGLGAYRNGAEVCGNGGTASGAGAAYVQPFAVGI